MFKNLIARITPEKKESNIANKEKETELNKVLNERSKEIEHLQEEKTKLNETLNEALKRIAHLQKENAIQQQDVDYFMTEAEVSGQENQLLKKQVPALMEMWKIVIPNKVSDLDTLQQMYAVAEQYAVIEEDSYYLYQAAKSILHTTVESEFPYEDARGCFENSTYRDSLDKLIASRFGKISWEIVHGTGYEKSSIDEYVIDYEDPKYLEFQREMYAEALIDMGYGDFVE